MNNMMQITVANNPMKYVQLTEAQKYCLGVFLRRNPSVGKAARFLRRHSRKVGHHESVGYIIGWYAAEQKLQKLKSSSAVNYYMAV